MKFHAFSRGIAALALLALAGCATTAETTTTGAPPVGVHSAPPQSPVNLTPTRDGAVIAPPMLPGGPPGSGMAGAAGGPVTPTKTVRVGLLLPLTGQSAELGRALQDAATVALFDKYARLSPALASTRVELLPKDSGDTPEQAQAAMKAALDDGAELIIGPIFGPATEAAAPLARARGVGVISFSNNRALAAPGVYTFGFSPQEQTARVLHYATTQGKGQIAALVPDSALGDLVLRQARETMQAKGSVLVAEAKYAPQGMGVDDALNKLIPPGGQPKFDALLLPEGGPSLGTILRSLAARGVTQRNVQFLGTGLWDEPTLLRRVNLDGAWLASSDPKNTAQFEQRFLATYKYVPPRIASLAYDAVALAVTLATSGRPLDENTLTNAAGYSGPANGTFRLRKNGEVQRSLSVLEVRGATLSVISAAPAGFTAIARPQ